MLNHDPATLALATSAAGYVATVTVLALTAIAAPTTARRREARTILALLLNRRL
ncbi:hypothetical protein ACIG5E_33550 [Kitasatospora sp. NPDC053057]|uniref:hypothetical protein n=1 Tax=Kitasatospora sp. NPDC053057 TaxID=3364062 RepID=UPI0037CC7610